MTVHKVLCEIQIGDDRTFAEYVPPKGIDIMWFWEYKGLKQEDRGKKVLALFVTSDKSPDEQQRHNKSDILSEVKNNRCYSLVRADIPLSKYKEILPPDNEPVMEIRAILQDPRIDKKLVEHAVDIEEVMIPDDQMAVTNAELRKRGFKGMNPKEGTKARRVLMRDRNDTTKTVEKPAHIYESGVIERG